MAYSNETNKPATMFYPPEERNVFRFEVPDSLSAEGTWKCISQIIREIAKMTHELDHAKQIIFTFNDDRFIQNYGNKQAIEEFVVKVQELAADAGSQFRQVLDMQTSTVSALKPRNINEDDVFPNSKYKPKSIPFGELRSFYELTFTLQHTKEGNSDSDESEST